MPCCTTAQWPSRRHDEAVQVDLEAVGDGVVCRRARVSRLVRTSASPSMPTRSAMARSSSGVRSDCLPRPAADVDAELVRARIEAALERASSPTS
jgi:hypothetical protein